MHRHTLVLLGALLALLALVFVPSLIGGVGGDGGADLDFAAAMGQSVWFAAAVVFVGGVLTSLSPCVYPLIPITVAIFGARSSRSRLRGAMLSIVYVLGMAIMYTGLGMAAAMTGKAFGAVMTNPWVIGTVAVVFVAFAFSLLGAFELNLPPALQTRLSQVGGEGLGGALAMGLVSGIVAAPCTGPVLGGVLTWVATTQNVLLGGGLLFTFAMGMGVLFFVLGTFAVSLPKSGPWMDTVKHLLAVIMLVAALFFLKDVISPLKDVLSADPWVPWATGGVAAVGILLMGYHALLSGTWARRVAKGGGLALLVGALFFRAGGLTVVPEAHADAVRWVHTEQEGLVLARESGQPVMLDFTADWCAACKELEKHTYPDPEVSEELSRFVAVRLDVTDDSTPEYERLQQKYGFPGLPYIVFIDSEGRQLDELTVTGFLPPEKFLQKLRAVD